MRNTAIRIILFDYGGVLAEEGFRHALKDMATEQGLNATDLVNQGVDAIYDSGFVLGKGTESDFWSLMRWRNGLLGEDDVLSKRIMAAFIIRPWMMTLVAKLRAQGYVTGILSDQTSWLDQLDARDHFYTSFDHVFNSYTLGKGKRDHSLYTEVAAMLGVEPNSVLFVDDTEDNVERAREVGFLAIHYSDKENFLAELQKVLGIELELFQDL
jgi:putative hydrolase of the HAD superfamily